MRTLVKCVHCTPLEFLTFSSKYVLFKAIPKNLAVGSLPPRLSLIKPHIGLTEGITRPANNSSPTGSLNFGQESYCETRDHPDVFTYFRTDKFNS